MTDDSATTPDASVLGRPNSYIGRSVPRPNARRLLSGHGRFVDDIKLQRMVHVAFVRSPYAHARITDVDTNAAAASAGVVRVVTGQELAEYCSPWVGVLTHFKTLKSAPQHAIAIDHACWQGEAVAVVVADSRAEAEDGAALVEVSYEELPVVTDAETAADPSTPVIHPELGDNIAFENAVEAGDVDAAFAEAALVVEETFRFERHTGVTLEPRVILADYSKSEDQLTVYLSNQAPHMMQHIFSVHIGVPEGNVRVICQDVGGSFGIKVHVYADEMATAALSKMLGRPVKFAADRLESFVTDIHARHHRIHARMGFTAEGDITAIEVDDLTGIGPYSMYPRTSAMEANQVLNFTGGTYKHQNYRAKARVVFQNKNVMCQYRAVGHPIAFAVTEGLVENGARQLGIDPVDIRRRNLIPDDAYPTKGVSGIIFEALSHEQSLDNLMEMLDYEALKAERDSLRTEGIYRGIGFATMIELTNPGAAMYGIGGARISSQDGAQVRLDSGGSIIVHTSITEQGQGTDTIVAQVAATAFGTTLDKVRVVTGDTDNVPTGGGTWGSRGAGIGGEAVLMAAKALRNNVTELAGQLLQAEPESLDIREGVVVDKDTGNERMPLEEVARIGYFRSDLIPKDFQAELMATRHFVPREYNIAFTNGIQACYVEVDPETGFVKILKHWVVEDCGTVINPLLVDEQVRGGVIQGLGGALLEECTYDAAGNMVNANMADYLVPMAGEMPDIEVGHGVTPTTDSELGAKGAGEAGTAGAPAAVMNAINDALSPFDVRVAHQPITPQRILAALGKF
ncbi:MAG: xanthine dehydrogenase family protein molybdopterin-binding subunit [Alphaproteobacteria bacterium]|nr:xanthine dehydrogenase family protein molybdopterin-binding subunit [Alphaproteobacteria bacterium]